MIIFLVVGTLFFLLGLFILISHLRFKRKAIQTKGRIVGYESYESKSKNSSTTTTMYTPVVEFEHGKNYRFISSVSSGAMGYEIEQEIDVFFDPDEPTKAKMDRPANSWLGLFIMLFGGIFMGIAIANISWSKGFLFTELWILIPFILFAFFRYFKKKTPEQVEARKARKAEFKKRMQARRGEVVTEDELDTDDLFSEKNPRDGVLGYQPSEHLITQATKVEAIKEKQKMPQWAKVVGLLIGIGLLAGGGYWAKTRYDFIATAETTQGTVVRFETHRSDGKTMYAPVVKYRANDGQEYQFKSKQSSSRRAFSQGELVKMYYQVNDPSNGLIDRGWKNWIFQGILLLIGFIISLLSLTSLAKSNKPREI